MRIAVLTRQIGNYHHARFAALTASAADFAVISLANEGTFEGFVSTSNTDYEVHRLYDNKASYAAAVREGRAEADVSNTLDTVKPDVVALPGWACAESFAGLRWAYRNNAAVVMMSDSQATDAARNTWREAIKARIIRYCDAGFVAGDAHREYLSTLGMNEDRITRGYDVIDNAHFACGALAARNNAAALRTSNNLPEGPYFLASSRFIVKKNLPALIEAYSRVAASQSDCPDLCILGDGEQRELLEALISKLGIANKVHLLGYRAYDDLPAIYGLAEAFIHPALHEQWGLVISEAGASGLPLAVSRSAGAAQLVEDGANGVLFDPAEPDEIENAIATLADLSAQQRRQWGKRSAAIMDDWGPERFVRGLHKASRLAIDHAASPGRRKSILAPDKLLIRYLSRKIIMDVT
ncbi:glycosyltransferase family 4 protein [Aurantiacibacter marinus]|uniref:Glycosyl transferase family 1 domain-containing protein n=1 Tax=Aurantiacibacter marinus TaxID=874156 RepID=A0A0H0XM76_9SPHN|nr:glycosyltransferase family 4 protein [Aurantiacibacter marinus]KLI63713.1 hypothetical protein AAV99_08260 [Aurantiacibacter marinus]